jgi:hypothetical protein
MDESSQTGEGRILFSLETFPSSDKDTKLLRHSGNCLYSVVQVVPQVYAILV